MACRGVHFAITDQQRDHLLGLADDDERVDYVQCVIEEEAMGGEVEYSFKPIIEPPEPSRGSIIVVGGNDESDEIGAELAEVFGRGLQRMQAKDLPQSEPSKRGTASIDACPNGRRTSPGAPSTSRARLR